MKQCYVPKNFSPAVYQLIAFIDTMIAGYQQQGLMLSVRQVYYQLVARGKIPNTEQSYKRTAGIINDARLAGLLDWDAIEDRNREIEIRSRWESGQSIINAAASSFHMDMWRNQEQRAFVIVEKAALAGVLDRTCREHDVPLLAARGYPSVTVVREMALQHFLPAIRRDQHVQVLHLGDHDPSGIDMTRDLRERLELFLGARAASCTLTRIALTMDQVEEKQPPPNPAKTTDSRFNGYMELYGDESWELDALEPVYLSNLVEEWLDKFIDRDNWKEREDQIEDIRARLTQAAEDFEE
jgi:hypothetical protein